MKLITLLGTLLCGLSTVRPHGYLTHSRVASCLSGPNDANTFPGLWWPEDGSGIPQPQCRAAAQYIRTKYLSQGSAYASDAMVYQFIQIAEFANLNPNYNDGPNSIRMVTGNENVCSGGAVDNSQRPFGDKSGFDIVSSWREYSLVPNLGNNFSHVELTFCVTADHAPSKWWVYETVSGFDPHVHRLTWDRLRFVSELNNLPLKVGAENPAYCRTNRYYTINAAIELNPVGTIVLVWQRIDPVGEFFIQCMDYRNANPSHSPSASD